MADKPYRIGIDLGGTNIKVGVVDAENKLLGKRSGKTEPFERSWQAVAADMARLAEELLAELRIPLEQCEKLGVGSPGMIDHINGVVVFAGNFGWDDVPLISELRRHLDLPMRLANDANCAVLGEAVAGAAKGARHVVLLTLGTGVGGGVVVDGVLQEGGSAGGMEYGHTVLCMGGEACTCGQNGCVEAYASATAIRREGMRAAEADRDSLMWKLCRGDLANMNGAIPFKAAAAGDAAGQKVVDYYIECLGYAIVNAINIWRPEKVLLGGGVANEGEPLFGPLNTFVRPRAFAGERGYVAPIIPAALGNDAGIYGAAAL